MWRRNEAAHGANAFFYCGDAVFFDQGTHERKKVSKDNLIWYIGSLMVLKSPNAKLHGA